MSEYYVMDHSCTVTTHFDERAKAIHFLIHALSGLACEKPLSKDSGILKFIKDAT